jgi:hypothetical protein
MSSLICDLASQRQFLVAAGSAGIDRPFGTERASSLQQILESGVAAPSAEKLSNVVEIAGQELPDEVQRDRLPKI